MNSEYELVDLASWDGTISLNGFAIAAHAFADKWQRFNTAYPSWSWIPCKMKPWSANRNREGYLSIEKICVLSPRKEDNNDPNYPEQNAVDGSADENDADCAMLVHIQQHEAHFYDFHIVYSASYRVPVLYFRAYSSEGQTLSLDAIERDLPGYSWNAPSQSNWTFITQEEHPHLERPWYKLHPCGTSEWMKLLFCGEAGAALHGMSIESYMVAWFSVVGQVIGVKIPFEMLNK